MPFSETLRDNLRQEKQRSKESLTNLCRSMANLQASRDHDRQLTQPQYLAHRPLDRRLDIIEISDDSEPPTPPRHALQPPYSKLSRPVLLDDSDSDDFHSAMSGSDSDGSLPLSLRPRNQARQHKRPKLRHSPTVQQTPAQRAARKPVAGLAGLLGRSTPRTELPARAVRQPAIEAIECGTTASFQFTNPVLIPDNPFDDPQPPPYYFDSKLAVEMYRGPSFERFPVVLGTVDGHREVCDKWKTRGSGLHMTVALPDIEVSNLLDEAEVRCLQRVLEVFPDVQRDFVLQKIREPSNQLNFNDVEIDGPTRIITQILEADGYPKARLTPVRPPLQPPPADETGVTVSYNKNQPKDALYLKEAVIILAQHFTHVPTHAIFKIVHQNRAVFTSYIHLQEAERDYYSKPQRPYIRHRQPRANLEKKYARGPHEQRDEERYAQIVNELQAAKQHVVREEIKATKQKANEEAEATNLAIHKASGSLIECQCCFDDEIPMNRSVGCESASDMHFFCHGCVSRLADNQIGVMKYEMLCMDGSGCKASLSVEGVAQAVSIKTVDKLAFNQQQAEIAAAGIDGLEQCPFCDFKAICEAVEQDRIFNCQNPDCGRATCRRCNQDAHCPKSCEEVKADKGLDARHRIEEARSNRVMRKCPKCSVKIIKELGCNKMICTSCRSIMCYACNADITKGKEGGYEHFHKPGSKCKLYDEPGVDRHDAEADEAEKEAIKKAKAEDAELDEKQLQIETGPGQKKAKPAPQAQPAIPQVRFQPLAGGREMLGGMRPMPGAYMNGIQPGRDFMGDPHADLHARIARQQQLTAAQIAEQARALQAHIVDIQRRVHVAHGRAHVRIADGQAGRTAAGLDQPPQHYPNPPGLAHALNATNLAAADAAQHALLRRPAPQNGQQRNIGHMAPAPHFDFAINRAVNPAGPAANPNQGIDFNNFGHAFNPPPIPDYLDIGFSDNFPHF